MTMRMKKLFSILAVAATVLLTACDEHQDFPDTAMKVTHILTTDGKVMPYETYEQSCKQAIAVVFNVNQREEMEGNGYAVYLWDIAPEAFADSIGVEQDTSCDLTAYDGNKNTFALYGTTDVKSPLAERVFDMWRYGQSAYIPSVAQMRLLYHAKDIINPYILKCGGTPIPGLAHIQTSSITRIIIKVQQLKKKKHEKEFVSNVGTWSHAPHVL